MITPIIIPTQNNTPKCPNCGNEENIKQVCRHCEYEYEEEEETTGQIILGVLLIILLVLVSVWIIITLIGWFSTSDENSLFDILKDQWTWIKSLKIK